MEYVVKIASDNAPVALLEAHALYRDLAPGNPSEYRSRDEAEGLAVARELADLRDHLGLSADISFHVCRHDEGIGDCSQAVVIF